MPNAAQIAIHKFVRDGITRLRGPQSYVPLSLDEVTPLENDGGRATFRVNGARVFIENSGEVVDAGLPDCPRYADFLLEKLLPAIAADLLMEGNPHKPFLDINSHTPESFEAYLQTGIPFAKEFPFPIAIVSRKMGNEANGMRSFFLLLDLFEVVIRFIVLVQIAEVMRGSQQTGAIAKNRGLSQLSEPTLGTWVNLFRQLRRFPTENPFLKEIKELNISDTLENFLELRNEIKGHGSTLAEAYYKSIFEQHIGEIEQLLRKVSFLRDYWLVKPISMENDSAYFRVSVWKLTGGNPNFDKRNIRSTKPLPTNKVVYLNQKLESLVLHPYVILEMCKQCEREELLLFDGLSEEMITYLGYESCPKRHKSSYPYANKLPQVLREANRRPDKK